MSTPQNNNSASWSVGNILSAAAVLVSAAGVVLLILWGQPSGPGADVYSYDSVKLPPIDPAMIHYKQVAQIAVKVKQPRGLAVDADKGVYVVGDFLECTHRSVPDAAPPHGLFGKVLLPDDGQCVAVDSAGVALVGEKDRVAIWSRGCMINPWRALTGTPDISSIAVTPDGKHVFVADRGNSWVVHYDGQGNVLGYIGRDDETGKPSRYHTQMISCFDIAIGPDGLLRVVDPARHVVDTYDLGGKLQCSVTLAGSVGCCNPTDIAMLPDGKIVASEKGANQARIKVYDASGKLESIVAGPGVFSQDNSLLDIAVDGEGRIYALDTAAGCVRVFEKIDQPPTSRVAQPPPALQTGK